MAGMTAGGRRGTGEAPARLLPALLCLAVLTACTGGGGSPDDDSPTEQLPVALEVTLAPGDEGLDEAARSEIETGVGDLLSSYVVDGFLGDYPRDDFVQSLDAFTTPAARRAVGDIDLLTGARFAERDAVRATQLTAQIASLRDGGDVLGATAHVLFEFEVAGADGRAQPFTLEGRFMLLEDEGEWTIFGYDVTRDDAEELGS
jgi:hypothetical protein